MAAGKHLPGEKITTHSFSDLKKILKRKRKAARKKDAVPKRDVPPDDEELFLINMKDVREIGEFREIPVYKRTVPKAPHPQHKNDDDREALMVLEEIVRGRRPVQLSNTQEYVEWVENDRRGNIVEELHAGRYSIQDCIDLHGIIAEEAGEEIEGFIRNSLKKGHRCIKIIHGRGLCSPRGPVLKDYVVRLLSGKFRKYVAAFVTARQCDGGLGAVYVLLK